jgi:adenylate cyclase
MPPVSKLLPASVALLVLAVVILTQTRYPQLFDRQRHVVVDSYMRLFPADRRQVPIALLQIDEASLSRRGSWPWPNTQLDALIRGADTAGAILVALVLIPRDTQTGSATAGAATGSASDPDSRPRGAAAPLVIGFALTDRGGSADPPPQRAGLTTLGEPWPLRTALPASLLPSPVVAERAAGIGALNVFPDRDGRLRRIPMLVQSETALYPTLLSEVLRVSTGQTSYLVRFGDRDTAPGGLSLKIGPVALPLNDNGELWLHDAPNADLSRYSAASLLADELPPGALEGKVVFVGVSAPGIGTRFTSALGEALTPAEIHAQAFAQLLEGRHPVRPDWALGAEIVAGALGALVLVVLGYWLRGLGLVLVGALLLVAITAGGLLAFSKALILLDPMLPTLSIGSVLATLVAGGYAIEVRQRAWIQRAFSSYLSPNLVRHLIHHPRSLRLTGERRVCSFVMTDLADFTPLVETLPPEELVDMLNRYLAEIVALIFRHEGTVERIVGDAVSVLFSAPVAQPDHARRAVALALDIDRFATAFADDLQSRGIPFGHTRIGVHSGEVLVGNFGGRDHLNYRALGDPINTAARLESANRHFGTRIAISGDTLAQNPGLAARPIGALLLKGKSRPVDTYTPLTPTDNETGLADAYTKAYTLAERDDPASTAAFVACAERFPDDALSRFHAARLQAGERGIRIRLEK